MAKRKTKDIKPIFWLAGSYYDCCKMWNNIIQMTTKSVGEPNVVSVECGFNPQDAKPESRVADASEIKRLLRMRDIFDERPRIIKMFGLPPDYSEITDYLRFVRNDNILVIASPIGYYKSKNQFVSAGSSKFYKYIKENGKVFNYETRAPSHKDAVAWVLGLATDYKQKLSKEVAQFLVDIKGLEYDTLYCEFLKLCDYADEEITVQTIEECSIPVFERTVWELIEKLNRQQYDEAMQFLEAFLDDVDSHIPSARNGFVENTLGALIQNFEALIHAKDRCKSSLSYGPFWNGIEPLKKWKTNAWVDRFSKGYCFAKLKDSAFQLAYGWPKSRIYGALLVIRHLHPRIRFDASNRRTGFTAICMYICGKLTERQALIVGGYAPEYVDEIVRVG